MLCLHLFNRHYVGWYQPVFFLFGKPLAYYIGLLSDACVPMFCFVTGFGFHVQFKKNALTLSAVSHRLKNFYIHFLMVLLFTVILFFGFANSFKPINFWEIVLNATGISNSMNSTWWYVATYVLLCLTSLTLIKWLNKTHAMLIVIVFFVVYCLAFYCRVYQEDLFHYNALLNWIYRQLFLLGTSFLPFVFGYLFSREQYFDRLSIQLPFLKNGIVRCILLLGLLILHGLIPNFIIAPFTALLLMVLIVNTTFSKYVQKSLEFIQQHSTNIWLLHFLFIQYPVVNFLPKLVYAPLIFLALFALSLFISLLLLPIQKHLSS